MDRLSELQTESQSYRAQDGGSLVGEARDRILQHSIALPVLYLKKGAQVMLIKNLDETLVNGSVGKVIDFMDEVAYEKQSGALDMSEFEKEGKDKPQHTSTRKWPLVRFLLPNGQTRDYLAKPSRGRPSCRWRGSGVQDAGTAHPGLGHVDPQVARPDAAVLQDQPEPRLREGSGLRRPVASHFAGGTAGARLQGGEGDGTS